MTTEVNATRKITAAEVKAAYRVLANWGGLRDRHLDATAIVETMLMRAADARLADTD